jgi:CheY-like chemotaxis protein
VSSNPIRVLVVEDVDDIRDATVAMLRLAGYDADAAAEAEGALARLARDPAPQVLFTDIALGAGLNGYELARRAVALRPGLRVLYTTGYAGKAQEPLPGSRTLVKPYRAQQMLHAIETLAEAVEK